MRPILESKGPVEPAFVALKPKQNRIDVVWGFTPFSRKEKDGRISVFIPGFDIYYSVFDAKEIDKKGSILTQLFLDHLLAYSKNKMKDFALEMHKRGFRAPKDSFVMKELMNNKIFDVKFKSATQHAPEGYSESEMVTRESAVELA